MKWEETEVPRKHPCQTGLEPMHMWNTVWHSLRPWPLGYLTTQDEVYEVISIYKHCICSLQYVMWRHWQIIRFYIYFNDTEGIKVPLYTILLQPVLLIFIPCFLVDSEQVPHKWCKMLPIFYTALIKTFTWYMFLKWCLPLYVFVRSFGRLSCWRRLIWCWFCKSLFKRFVTFPYWRQPTTLQQSSTGILLICNK